MKGLRLLFRPLNDFTLRAFMIYSYSKLFNSILNQCRFKLLSFSLCMLALSAFTLNTAQAQVKSETPSLENKSTINQSDLAERLNLEQVKSSGQQLMSLPLGLTLLNQKHTVQYTQSKPVYILVHGYKSAGYEWVYAVKKLAQKGPLYFYRWDWNLCPKEGAWALGQALTQLRSLHSNHELTLIGHSYGGVISAIASAQYQGAQKLKTHMIASPLAGHSQLEARCPSSITSLTQALQKEKKPIAELQLHQWRTQQNIDGAFKDLSIDPQVVNWQGESTRLPMTYKGNRLGHNWSISWVIDQLLTSTD